MKYQAKVFNLASGIVSTLEGSWDNEDEMRVDLTANGYLILDYWMVVT